MSVYDKMVGATAEGLLPPAVLGNIGTNITTTGTLPVGKGEIVLSARDFGAAGDGIADDTASLQAALNASAGRDVLIPRGRYRITQELTVPSGGTVRGENGTVLVNDANLGSFVSVTGTTGTPLPIAVAVGTGDRTITTTTAHGLAAGDIVRFTSQRISTSDDAGEWRLGHATSSGSGPFFGEHAQVQSVTSPTVFVLDSGLVFPSYRPDNTQETHPDAGLRATVAKVEGARNVVISTLVLEGPSTEAIRLRNAVDSVVENVRYSKPDIGRFIQFSLCYRVEARNCWVSNDVDASGGVDTEGGIGHADLNSYHVEGSQSTGFVACTALSGTQPFDLTYAWDAPIPSSFCYVRDCSTYAALHDSMTVHPGTYAPVITGNSFVENGNHGPSIRGNRAIVSGNQISGSGIGTGIRITEGGGKDSVVSGNHVTGFSDGFMIQDGAGKIFEGWIGLSLVGNYFDDFDKGFRHSSMFGRALPTGPQGIHIHGNSFVSSRASAVAIESSEHGRAVWGLVVQGNSFRLSGGAATAAVSVTNSSRGVVVKDNTVWEAGRTLQRLDVGTEQWAGANVTELTGNTIFSSLSAVVPPNTATWRMRSTDPDPHTAVGVNLNDYVETVVIRAAANSGVTFANNFPVENTTVVVYVSKMNDASVYQEAVLSTGVMYFRRLSGTAWSAWSARY